MPLRVHLGAHEVATAYELGWSTLENGALLDAAVREGFAVLVTTDASLEYQQNLASRPIAIVVLMTTSWPRIERAIEAVIQAIERPAAGTCTGVEIP